MYMSPLDDANRDRFCNTIHCSTVCCIKKELKVERDYRPGVILELGVCGGSGLIPLSRGTLMAGFA